ncbi:CocE/NonD family hydrolase [uncultured Roseibium sp.]|uniref:CocE/NonD family hydrolase n=1 Tax=uncultured Roseibium sp. TaxID=1936171 RepID=UPI00260A2357|nr:CocE/NonD family hydrolase [uncultured Roseibium sp.]
MPEADAGLGPAVLLADDVVVHRNVMVTMRDGVRLATDIYRPASSGRAAEAPRPVILERTPYNKSGTPRTEFSVADPTPMTREALAARLVREGYVAVFQDCRGRHGSEGTFTKYVHEGEDGYDTMAWITAQPFCSGRIGTMGLSYAAHTQMALACLNPPGLACMILDSGGFSNAFTCGIRQGGALELKQAIWAYNHAMESPAALRDPTIRDALSREDLEGWMGRMPWTAGRSPLKWDPDYEQYLLDQWQNGTFDGFWKKIGLWAAGHYHSIPKIPVVFMSSWYDTYVQTALENHAGLKAERPTALIMGPWTHGNRSRSIFGDVDFGPAALFDGQIDADWLTYRLRWFAHWLKEEAGTGQERRVHYFLMGGGSGRKTAEGHLDHGGMWCEAPDWPVPGAVPLDLHLHPDMRLDEQPPAVDERLSYDFDPRDPVPTIGGALTSGEPIFTGGGFDQVEAPEFFGCQNPGRPLKARRDVLCFETAPLEEDLIVVGPVSVRLLVSTDAPDTDFTAKLIDVYPPSRDYPNGYALNITDGIFRVRYRDGFEQPKPVGATTGAFSIEITPFATANRFARGHRLRLDISSSNFPKYDVNPNTGEPEGRSRQMHTATNTIHLGPEGSVLTLHVL